MKSKYRAFIQGMGSILDLSPTDYQTLLPQKTAAQRMAHNFERVGAALTHACQRMEQDVQATRIAKPHSR